MTQRDSEALVSIQFSLEQILLGKNCSPIEMKADSETISQIVELLNMLVGNISEMRDFSLELSKGNLNVSSPGRRNYMAAPLKALHSQLNGFVWRVQQMQKGHVVDRLDYMGDIALAFNALLDRMMTLATQNSVDTKDMMQEQTANSWQFHQMSIAFHNLHFMVLQTNPDGKILFANKAASSLLNDLTTLDPAQSSEKARELVAALRDANTDTNTFPFYRELQCKSTGVWYKIITEQILFPNNQLLYLHTIDDISEWKISQQELQLSASIDPLTGAFNRAIGLAALESILRNPAGPSGCAAFIDVDGLKTINDSFGHNEGDFAIKKVAHVLLSSVRDEDTVSRFGGDEFLITFQHCSLPVAERIVARMNKKLDQVNQKYKKPFQISFSYGLVQISDALTSSTVQDIIQLADKKMYGRKAAKKRDCAPPPQ